MKAFISPELVGDIHSKTLANIGYHKTAQTPFLADNETCIAWSESSVGSPHAHNGLHAATQQHLGSTAQARSIVGDQLKAPMFSSGMNSM